MPVEPPTLARALLTGSFRHCLAGFIVPVAVFVAALALRTRSVTSELWVMLALSASALGAVFLFHEIVALLAVAIRLRRPPEPPVETDVAVDIVTAVLGADLVVLCLGMLALVLFGVKDWIDLWWILVFFLPGLYGVYLLGGSVRRALAPPPVAPATPGTGQPEIARGPSPGRTSVGLQIYVTVIAASLAFAWLGWQQDTAVTFAVGFVSIALGRIVASAAARWNPDSD
jgi:hypothetical protein